MANFATPELNAAVDGFKKIFASHTQLYQYGQFYLTNRVLDDVLAVAKDEISRNVRFTFNPALGQQILDGLRGSIAHIPLPFLNLEVIDRILASVEVNGDMAAIRAMFAATPPGPAEARAVQTAYNIVWSKSDIGAAKPYLSLAPSIKMARGAFAFEKDKCFSTCRSFASKLLAARKMTTLPKSLGISMGTTAGATLIGKPAGPGPVVEQQTIAYTAPSQLDVLTKAMRKAIDASAVVQCGVLSGARLDKNLNQRPEHYVLTFAYGTVESMDALLFWDPDAAATNIRSASWGRGFGVLFSRPGRFSTAIDDADLTNIDRDRRSPTFGDHRNEPKRHCYQVFYLQTLPM
jgi:hypothetical protein